MRNIHKDLKVGDVVRLRNDIMKGMWRHESPVGWCDEMEDLIDEKVIVEYINYNREDRISFRIKHRSSQLSQYAYSSEWFNYAEILEGVEEL